jgi:ferredoxin
MEKIAVDLTRCAGHGKCYILAPDLFAPFDDDGRSEWIGDPIAPEDEPRRAQAERAIVNCPEHALSWTSDHQRRG